MQKENSFAATSQTKGNYIFILPECKCINYVKVRFKRRVIMNIRITEEERAALAVLKRTGVNVLEAAQEARRERRSPG